MVFAAVYLSMEVAIVFPLFVKTVLDVLWIVGFVLVLCSCFSSFYMNDAKALGLCYVRSRIMYGIMFMITLPRHCKNYD